MTVIEKIQDHVSYNEIQEAFQLLKGLLKDKNASLFGQAQLLSNQFKDYSDKEKFNMPYDPRERQRIVYALLSVCREAQERNFDEEYQPPKSQEPKNPDTHQNDTPNSNPDTPPQDSSDDIEMYSPKAKHKIFIGYVNEDQEYLEAIERQFAPLKSRKVEIWHQGKAGLGEIDLQRDTALTQSHIIILLVSESFIASDEGTILMEYTKQLRKRSNKKLLPVILDSCLWEYTPLQGLVVFPSDKTPINKHSNRGAILNKLIRKVIDILRI